MSEEQAQTSRARDQMQVVTISREYGSGGGEIAHRLAERLHWDLVDHKIVVEVAQELQVSESDVEEYDERGEGFIARFLSSLQGIDQVLPATAPLLINDTLPDYQSALTRVVKAAILTGHVVLVGRGSQVLLGNRQDALHIRIIAPFELRTKYVMQREGLSEEDAKTRLRSKDRDRERYLQDTYKRHPDDPKLYDLVINTAVFDLDSAVDLIELALDRKATRLSIPPTELGPAFGLLPYPDQPGDFHVSK
jgi:cytidylate kinase